jgi:hypothetical protein
MYEVYICQHLVNDTMLHQVQIIHSYLSTYNSSPISNLYSHR